MERNCQTRDWYAVGTQGAEAGEWRAARSGARPARERGPRDARVPEREERGARSERGDRVLQAGRRPGGLFVSILRSAFLQSRLRSFVSLTNYWVSSLSETEKPFWLMTWRGLSLRVAGAQGPREAQRPRSDAGRARGVEVWDLRHVPRAQREARRRARARARRGRVPVQDKGVHLRLVEQQLFESDVHVQSVHSAVPECSVLRSRCSCAWTLNHCIMDLWMHGDRAGERDTHEQGEGRRGAGGACQGLRAAYRHQHWAQRAARDARAARTLSFRLCLCLATSPSLDANHHISEILLCKLGHWLPAGCGVVFL